MSCEAVRLPLHRAELIQLAASRRLGKDLVSLIAQSLEAQGGGFSAALAGAVWTVRDL